MDKKIGKAVKGSVEKSEYFMYFLLSAFCPEGGVVLDFLAGAGTSISAARKVGLHLLAIDNDAECVEWMKENRGIETETLTQEKMVENVSMIKEISSKISEMGSPRRIGNVDFGGRGLTMP